MIKYQYFFFMDYDASKKKYRRYSQIYGIHSIYSMIIKIGKGGYLNFERSSIVIMIYCQNKLQLFLSTK